MPRTLIWVVTVAVGLAACGGNPATPSDPPGGPPASTDRCARTTGYTALSDPGPSNYQGQPGGLYPGGANGRPASHEVAGVALARGIGPLNAAGVAAPNGRYALVSIGFSNATQEFSTFKPLADTNPQKDPRLVVVDGAQGGQASGQWADPSCACWGVLLDRLTQAGLTPNQVAIVWMKLALVSPNTGWPAAAQTVRTNGTRVLQLLKQRFPNLVLTYLASRIYGGYATGALNPEPYAYETGFSVRWIIEDQLNGAPGLNFDPARGAVSAPWVAWGPYLWADGLRARGDGLTWSCSDMEADGVHPAPSAERKVADMLLAFFKSDTTAREWFLASP
jgi:hypothetical protein